MSTLLISLGTSPAIVPEAVLYPYSDFDNVHILTTERPETDLITSWFADVLPKVKFTITRVSGFMDFTSEQDHNHFEEVLFRWWLTCRPTNRSELPYVCLSGGFKTMSASVQKAADLFGAAEVFHVLCSLPPQQQPNSIESISAAQISGDLHWINLGKQPGWPALQSLAPDSFPLEYESVDEIHQRAQAPNQNFREHLTDLTQRSHNVADRIDQIAQLPFPSLASWPGHQLAWLEQPVDPTTDRKWIAALPKVELHCHLGGFATHGEALQAVRSAADYPDQLPKLEEPGLPEDWPTPNSPIALIDYMALGDANGSAILKDPGCLRKQCELLYQNFVDQQVVYAEVRCSPANYRTKDRSPWQILSDLKEAFDDCMLQHDVACHVNLIIIATRREQGDYRTAIARHLALAVSASEHWQDSQACRVVGVDLAGYEDVSTRAHYFREEFTSVHRCGLALTVHAGENDDAEGIWRAVFDLNTRRLGHALHLSESDELLQSVADRGIGVEMCPYANYQIKGFAPMGHADGSARATYPLRKYLDRGVRVCLNTDNIGISNASITDNYIFAQYLCPDLKRVEILRMIANGLQAAFVSPAERDRLQQMIEKRLQQTI